MKSRVNAVQVLAVILGIALTYIVRLGRGYRVCRRSAKEVCAMQVLAVILGIALTYIIRPGRDKPFEHGSGGDCAAKMTDTISSKKCAQPSRCCPWHVALLCAARDPMRSVSQDLL